MRFGDAVNEEDMQDEIAAILKTALLEDAGSGDVTGNSVIPADAVGRFIFNARESMVFCGADVIKQAFKLYPHMEVKVYAKDGDHLPADAVIAEIIWGNVREVLLKERVVLNLIQFLSSIATETAKYVKAVEGTRAKILDTRKTIPGLRKLTKYAVKCGGGENHRMGLYDMVMIKDNHIHAAGGITEAVNKARSTGLKIEVECDSLEQVKEALAAGADIILADNMSLPMLSEAVKLIGGRVPVEASGNVSLDNIRKIAETGPDFISTSKITIGAKPVDIGLDNIG